MAQILPIKKMKALYISSKPAYPIVDGGAHATAAFLDTLLGTELEVDYLFICTKKHPFIEEKFPAAISEKTTIGHVTIDTSVRIFPAIKFLIKKGSYNVDRFYSKEMSALIRKRLLSDKFDFVILDSLFTTGYLDEIKAISDAKITVRTHNVEGDLWHSYASNARGLKSIYLKKLAKDIARYEKETLMKVDGILPITKDDSERFKNLGISTKKCIAPVSMKVIEGRANYKYHKVYHIGSMDWEPNRESVDKLIEIWPNVRSKNPSAELSIAGKQATQFYSANRALGIHVFDFVDNTIDFAVENGILATPIHSGSGVRIKILEAMSTGIPVISTPIGAMGIDYQTTECIRIVNDDNELVDAIAELITSEEERTKFGTNALDYIRKNHNIAKISQSILEFFKSI